MKIYTKKGDKGWTSSIGVKKCRKTDELFEVLGDIDELNAWIGTIRLDNYNRKHIQSTLMAIGTLLAEQPQSLEKARKPDCVISATQQLERWIDAMEKKLPVLNKFILPTCHDMAHVARAVCRRAERRLWAWPSSHFRQEVRIRFEKEQDEIVLYIEKLRDICGAYLNRLSDYLFVSARLANREDRISEIHWTWPERD